MFQGRITTCSVSPKFQIVILNECIDRRVYEYHKLSINDYYKWKN